MQNFRDALLLHCHAVEHIRGLHRAAPVGDDDELRFAAEPVQIRCKSFHVPVVQRRVNFIEHAKRRRPHLQNREIQRNGHKCLLAAGKKRDGLELLSGGLDLDFNAAGKRLFFVLQFQRRFAAAEHFRERRAEILVDARKLAHKNLRHLAGNIADDGLQLCLCVQHVVALRSQILVALADSGVFVDRAEVRRTERGHFPLHLADAPVCARDGLDLHSLLLCARGRELIGLPELVDELLLLELAGRFLLLESCRFALEKQNVLVLVLRLLFGLVALCLHGGARLDLCFERLLVRLRGFRERFHLLVLRLDLLLSLLHSLAEGRDQRLLLDVVALHGLL